MSVEQAGASTSQRTPELEEASTSLSDPTTMREDAQPARRSRLDRFLDAGWGTQRHTPNAALQLPRKVPMRVDPKAHFALERTFLSWTGMSITLAATSTILSSLASIAEDNGAAGLRTRHAVATISLVFAPAGAAILAYATFVYILRCRVMRSREMGFHDDRIGPLVITGVVAFTLCVLTVVAYFTFLSS